ncbi:MAG: carboxypeptidase-like regulatory domain-containing protein [Methanomassiliicoccus sp.]|nr:carboxypeptidase-like regulatory domain-containing protein [Methanomassiliicoccus sp.]
MRWPALVLAFMLVSIALLAGSAQAADTLTISGKVTNISGVALSGVTITIRNLTSDDTHIVTTDTSGRFSHSTAPGNYSVTATYNGYRANVTYAGVDRTSANIDFTMYEVLGTVTGQVTDGNTTLAGVLVTLTGVNASFSTVSSAPLGTYRIDNVTPGTYMVSASKEGYNTSYHSELVTLVKGSVEEVSFTLAETTVQYAKLSGRVTFNGDPLEGVKVVLTPEEGADLVTVTDAGGNYSFSQVSPGDYIMYLSKDGYVTSEKKITMEPLKGLAADFSMKRNTLPGNSGFVLDYDLSHSMMILGLGLALMLTLASLILRQRIKSNPDLLAKEEEEKPGTKEKSEP